MASTNTESKAATARKDAESQAEIPDRLAFKIGETSRLVGVKPHVLRFWEQEFGRLRPTKTASGHRLYSRSDVVLLRTIRTLLHCRGYTIAGARSLIQRGDLAVRQVLDGAAAAPSSPDRGAAERELRAQVDQLKEALAAATRALDGAVEEAAFWKADAQDARRLLSSREAVVRRVIGRLHTGLGSAAS